MKLTVQQVFDATPVIAGIINSGRALPLKGSYRLIRLHAKLAPELKTISDKRDELLKEHATPIEGKPDQFTVTPAFAAAWTDFAKDEIEITDLNPVPLAQLDFGDRTIGAITALELIALGPLVTDD